jgi:hypothetical protein
MPNFFHLSKSPSGKAIVVSSDELALDTNAFFSPRKPRDHCEERPDPRICVAPHVWQCLISVYETETPPLFIYRLGCSGAIRATADEHHVEDSSVTHEHWIVDDVIGRNGGVIPVTCVGVLKQVIEHKERIRQWMFEQKNNLVDPNSLDELEHLWVIDEATDPAEWRLRLAAEQDSADEAPLPLPPTWP